MIRLNATTPKVAGEPETQIGDADMANAVLSASPVRLELRNGGEMIGAWPAVSALSPAKTFEIVVDGRAALVHERPVTISGRELLLTATVDIDTIAKTRDELFQLAYFDPLTGAPNRSFFDKATQSAIDGFPSDAFAVAVLEIDRFGPIDEYYGRAFADALIGAVARRLQSVAEPSDIVACSGVAKFYLSISAANDAEAPRRRIDAMLQELRLPIVVDGHEVLLAASLGVSLFPGHGASGLQLRERAEEALKLAKRGDAGGVVFFDPDADLSSRKSALHEQNLRQAIRDRRLVCAFQPKVDFRANAVVGLEALMRWRDENGELRAPGDLLTQAHSTGLIDDVTWLVLDDAIASLPEIDAAFGKDVTIGFNISAAQAGDMRFMRNFSDRLKESGVGSRFMVELTEEAFVSASHFQSNVVPLLRSAGAKISIDDFGVGYSSLANLADITADELKVDRSFIVSVHQRPRSQSLLRAIESIGTALNMRVVVEGVETEEELSYLRDSTNISVVQGYYFSKPVTLHGPSGRRQARAGAELEGTRPDPTNWLPSKTRGTERRET